MEKKLGLKVISSAALAGLLFAAAPALPANAASDNYAETIPVVQDDTKTALGSLVIEADGDTKGSFRSGDRITVTLPSGVEFVNKPADVAKATYLADNFTVVSGTVSYKIHSAAKNYITVEFTGGGEVTGDLMFKFPNMDIDKGVTGDIKVDIDAVGTRLTSDSVTIGRVVGGDTVTTIADVETFGIDTAGNVLDTIRIKENVVGVLDGGDIKLILPNGYEWEVAGTIDEAGLDADSDIAKTIDPNDKRVMKITGVDASAGQPGFISLSGLQISVPDDAKNGDEVELTVKGGGATEEDIIIAKIGDFGFEVEAEGDIETVIAGKVDQDVAQINIKDLVDGSWINNRTVKLELPSWATWGDTTTIAAGDPVIDKGLNDDNDVWTLQADGDEGDLELDDLTVNIDADAPEGDLVVKITGSQGIEEEVVIAKVLPPFKVSAEKPEFIIGAQYQELGNITITETEEEALVNNKWIVVKAPVGMYFAETPTVKVTDGDIEIDDDDSDGRYFAFRIDSESNKQASEIEISDIQMTLDRTVPVGDITFEVFMTKNNTYEADGTTIKDDYIGDSDDFDAAIEKARLDSVVDVVVGTVVTPVEGENQSVVMNLGSTLYTVNGATKVMDVAPQVINGRTFTPVRYVAESLGATVAYDDATKTATLTKGETVVEFVLGSSTYTVNGVAQTADVAAQAINGRTMLPARYVAEAFGYQVGFDPATKTVVISK